MTLTGKTLYSILQAISTVMIQQQEKLNRLDAELGDGDHGTSIANGFKAAVDTLSMAASPPEMLKMTAMTLMNRMGGSSGALYGTLFLRASAHIQDTDSLSLAEFAAMWQKGLEGVQQRGKAQKGDKTMLDALIPAVAALRDAASEDDNWQQALDAAAEAAESGAQATAQMQAKHGRARYVGERAVGHVDAGAQSVAFMFVAMRNYWKEQDDAT